MRLYTDEDVPLDIIGALRTAGHDVVTALEAGLANRRVPDPEQLAHAIAEGCCILTMNRRDFARLHRSTPRHAGIILCARNLSLAALGPAAAPTASHPISNAPGLGRRRCRPMRG